MTLQYYEAYVELVSQLCGREDYGDKQKVRRHNAAMKKLQALQMKMCEDLGHASDAIEQLLESDYERVRVYIAYFCVEQNLYAEKAANVLRGIVKHSDDKMHRYYAHMALKQHLHEEYQWC